MRRATICASAAWPHLMSQAQWYAISVTRRRLCMRSAVRGTIGIVLAMCSSWQAWYAGLASMWCIPISATAIPSSPWRAGLRVVIVGRGGEHEAPLRARITALSLDDTVTLAEERRKVAPILQAADLFVQPSVIEGLPLALLEAMAAGVPTLATAVGGVPRIVEDRITGRLVQPADPLALAEAMQDLIDHPDHPRRMAADAQERGRRPYRAKAWADP